MSNYKTYHDTIDVKDRQFYKMELTAGGWKKIPVNLDSLREQRFEQACLYAAKVCGYPAAWDNYYGDSADEFVSKNYESSFAYEC